ncbi:MAG: TauD/TfdA family dioxygenase [Burkholderiaceae bacterium]
MRIEPSGQTSGALIHDLDLRKTLSAEQHQEIRKVWLQYQVVGITGQSASISDIERFAAGVGPFGEDPFIAAIPGHDHVIEVRRDPNEKAAIFAGNWHSDWSFLASPPAATLLYGEVIPPIGGDTLFANLYAAYEALPDRLRAQADAAIAVHSAKRSYSNEGRYSKKNDQGRSMDIRSNDSALATQTHPLVRTHPETGRKCLFASPAYTLKIDNMPEDEGNGLLAELFEHMDKPEFTYRHEWRQGMLTIWDNRCLNHKATGGFEGHQRLLYRITVGEQLAA